MTSEVTDLMNALKSGRMTLGQVAENFRERSWPQRTSPLPTSYLELAAAAQQDPGPYEPNSFDDVAVAHQQGIITDEQYSLLAKAAAESKHSGD